MKLSSTNRGEAVMAQSRVQRLILAITLIFALEVLLFALR
jgi:hypothetical protein